MYRNILQLMLKESWTDLKLDFQTFRKIKSKSPDTLTVDEKIELMKIHNNFRLMIGPMCVGCMPMAAPLLLLYIYKLPEFTPNWVLIDTLYDKLIVKRK